MTDGRFFRSLSELIVAAVMAPPHPAYGWDEVDRRLAYRRASKKRAADPVKKAARKRQKKARAIQRRSGK
ncbi:hypothetical protein [Mesorhizobium sp. B2-4-6]|uniref:hypothetical protein n=1 Tax=Mesorhizobium sp. B2-4-6 TaxID=2589943 RepID=UPI0011262E25|nr:hypothetical protein [Mesorhizobium sp. B2-4-6]TPL40669.1 hypothetical protein FJ957_25910 [Mesorhizobium sp. B2-4-6]